MDAEQLLRGIDDVYCWISWDELDDVVRRQAAAFTSADASVQISVRRLAASIGLTIAWHT